MIKTYSYKRDKDIFLTPHFQVYEFRSYNDALGYLTTDTILIDENLPVMLEKLYEYCDKKHGISYIRITSGYRSQDFEDYLGGIKNGFHVQGKSADILTYKKDGTLIPGNLMCCYAEEIGFNGIGYMGNAIHVDTRNYKSYFNEINGDVNINSWYTYFNIKKEEPPIIDPEPIPEPIEPEPVDPEPIPDPVEPSKDSPLERLKKRLKKLIDYLKNLFKKKKSTINK